MAGVQVEAGSELAQKIQAAVQPKLIENTWVAEENDMTLSEYVTMMVVNGKNLQDVAAETGELVGTDGDDPVVMEFAQWLFNEVYALANAEQAMGGEMNMQQQEQPEAQAIPSLQDSQMDDATATVESIPSGPKAMRNGAAGRGRGGRMLGQMNSHMNRDQNLPDPLRRIKGAAGGQHGRIDAHAGRGTPRGPRGSNVANGLNRMMNGGRGAHGGQSGMNPMMAGGGQLNNQQQMAFMQMMEMQANLMQQMMNNGGQLPNFGMQNGGGHSKSLFDRVDKRGGHRQFKNQRQTGSQNGDSSMEVDAEGNKKEPFDIVCRFNTNCTNPSCPYAHQSPAAPPGQTMDLSDTCSFGPACQNRKCVGRHPSPAQRTQHKQEVDCKFFPNCTNPNCPFRHPDMPLCRNGADCAVPGCKYTHSKIACRYNPCTKPHCPFKHTEGQKGVFKDKVWTAGGDGVPNVEGENQAAGTMGRFEGFKNSDGAAEELILPGQQNGEAQQVNGGGGEQAQDVVT